MMTRFQLILGQSTQLLGLLYLWQCFSQYIPTCASKIVKYAFQETKIINVVSYWVMAGLNLWWKSTSRIVLTGFDQICNFVVKKAFCYCYFISTLSNWLNDQLIEWPNIAQNVPFSRRRGGRGGRRIFNCPLRIILDL